MGQCCGQNCKSYDYIFQIFDLGETLVVLVYQPYVISRRTFVLLLPSPKKRLLGQSLLLGIISAMRQLYICHSHSHRVSILYEHTTHDNTKTVNSCCSSLSVLMTNKLLVMRKTIVTIPTCFPMKS